MELTALVVEALFLVLFVATLVGYLRHRDPVRRDVMLVFSGLAVLFVAQLWKGLGGIAPVPLTIVGGVLLLLQPVFTLHLASLVRGVPRTVLFGAVAVLFVSTAMLALYLNVFVLIVQLFQKVPALKALAPTQSEPPFVVAQSVVLLIFIALAVAALRSFHPPPDTSALRAA